MANPVLAILIGPIWTNPIWANPTLANPFLDLVWVRGLGPRRVGRPKITHFIFPSPAPIFAIFVSLWVSSRGILVFEGRDPQNVHVWSSRVVA